MHRYERNRLVGWKIDQLIKLLINQSIDRIEEDTH